MLMMLIVRENREARWGGFVPVRAAVADEAAQEKQKENKNMFFFETFRDAGQDGDSGDHQHHPG